MLKIRRNSNITHTAVAVAETPDVRMRKEMKKLVIKSLATSTAIAVVGGIVMGVAAKMVEIAEEA